MKKFLVTLLLLAFFNVLHAQNNLYYDILDGPPEGFAFCQGEYDTLVLFTSIGYPPYIFQTEWDINYRFCNTINGHHSSDHVHIQGEDSIYIYLLTENLESVEISYISNNYDGGFGGNTEFELRRFDAPEPWTDDYLWKRYQDSIRLRINVSSCSNTYTTFYFENIDNFYQYVSEPGTYTVHVYNDCGELFDTIEVRDNVEIYRASSDLLSNHNMITWKTTPEQSVNSK